MMTTQKKMGFDESTGIIIANAGNSMFEIDNDRCRMWLAWICALMLIVVAGCTTKQDESGSLGQSEVSKVNDWPQFRGPDFCSRTAADFPLQWDVDDGIAWISELPGRGASSPIVVGDQIFVTAYDGWGLTAQDEGDHRALRHHLLCLDRETGSPIWQREITGTSLKQKMNPELARHGFASSTPTSDGKNVYVSFGATGIFAFSCQGDLLWQKNLGLGTHYFGASASPVLFQDLVIVNSSIESRCVYALNKNTGSVVWKIPDVVECWSMPVIGQNPDRKAEMIMSSKNRVAAYDPLTGETLWSCPGVMDYVVSVPIIVDGVCYLTGGKEKQTMAIRMGKLDTADNEKRKIWEIKKIGSNVSSPVFHVGRLFIFHDSGVIQVIDAKTGKLVKRHRTATRERPFASPLLAGNRLVMGFQDAGVAIHQADDECKQLAVVASPDKLPLMASVVPTADRFLIRSDKSLTCVATGTTNTSRLSWNPPANFQTIKTVESYNIDPKKGWTRRYMGFLTPDFQQAIKFLLMPYQSVITDDQTAKSREIILGEKPKYDALRKRFEQLQWQELTSLATAPVDLQEKWSALEADTKQLNEETRILVKKLFPDEQLQQHYRDARAGIGHIKPDQKK